MLRVLLGVLCFSVARLTVVTATPCDPARYLCAGECPPLPNGIETPTSEAVCSKDPESDTCICWLHNPSSQLHTLFQCEAKINDSLSKIACFPPSHCFSPDANIGCLIILRCQCLLFEKRHQFQKTDSWKRVKAVVHTMKKSNDNQNGHSIEKIQDVREFSLKHLLFLLGFVIAPLMCWCLLNFFHEGKCRKKPSQPPEAQPIPTSRSSTVDNLSNSDGEQNCDDTPVIPILSRSSSVQSQTCSIHLPSAPDLDAVLETEAQQETLLKCESPPPYCESVDRSCHQDCGPPPTYEDAVRDSDVNVQQLWQTVFIVQPGARGNS